jgi:hypothetical protein
MSSPTRQFASAANVQLGAGPRTEAGKAHSAQNAPPNSSFPSRTAAAAGNLRRIRRLETSACSTVKSYSELLDNEEIQTKLDRLGRHKARIERTLHRSLLELKAVQTNDVITSGTRPPRVSATEIAHFCKTNPIRHRKQCGDSELKH